MRRFKNEETENLWKGLRIRRLDTSVQKQALRRLQLLIAAKQIEDLRVPPGNMLETLSGDRKGWYSIRVNMQYRLCFKWSLEGAYEIEFVDYH